MPIFVEKKYEKIGKKHIVTGIIKMKEKSEMETNQERYGAKRVGTASIIYWSAALPTLSSLDLNVQYIGMAFVVAC